MTPLISIIIPTKNRQYTALFAIRTALAIASDDIEVVVQDCSENNSLQPEIEKLGDKRIKYFFQNDPISMTENWTRAYENATGEYLIGIGDDDAVFPEILQVAEWAKRNKIEAVGHTEPYQYFWPSFPGKTVRRRLLLKEFSGKVNEIEDLRAKVIERSRFVDGGYSIDLPMIYHRLIARTLLDRLKARTGKLIDGTSLDVYSSFAIGLIADQFFMVDYPFSMRGACGDSNSGRFAVKKDKEHFKEYKYIDYPEWLPKIEVVHVTIAESIYRAFVNTGNQELIGNISLPYLYAFCLVDRPEKKKEIIAYAEKYLDKGIRNKEFHRYYRQLKRQKWERELRELAEYINRFVPLLSLYRKMIGKRIIRLNDVLEVQSFHRHYIRENKITLQLP